jgi:alpha-glucosidase
LGEYIVTVREGKDGNWYVGGLTNWEARDIDLNFDFLPKDRTFEATLYADGLNAHRQAQDYQCRTFKADASTSQSIHLAPGGGFVLRLVAR